MNRKTERVEKGNMSHNGSTDNTAAVLSAITKTAERLAACTNGDKAPLMRELGDKLAILDQAAWIDARQAVVDTTGLKASEVTSLRSEGRQRHSERRRQAKERVKAAETSDKEPTGPDEPAYFVKYGLAGTPMLYWRKQSSDGAVDVLLAHFVPKVIAERVRHRANGETLRIFTIQLETARGVRVFDVEPPDLGDPKRFFTACLQAAGADAIAKKTERPIRDAAMELADPERERSEIFEYTGWHEHQGQLVYLSAAGAIGTADTLSVDLSLLAAGTGFPTLANFGPRDDGDDAFKTALEALAGPVRDCLGDAVMLPQLATVALAPLLRWAPIGELPVLHVMGATGKGKTRSARILQGFYGLDKTAASWAWTQAAIEVVSSSLRDCIVCIDDLKASTCDPRIAVRTMQRWADRRPRVRSNRSGSGLIGSPHIASLMLSNGEDLPSGEASVAARALFIPVWDESFNEEAFQRAEAMIDALPTLTARYIAWLIGQENDLAALIGDTFREARRHYHAHVAGKTRINDAGRVASSCGLLETGAAIMALFLQAVGWSNDQAAAWVLATRHALEDLASAQAGMIDEESHAALFLASVVALLDSREAELVEVEANKSFPPLAGCSLSASARPGARLLGWQRGGEVLLDPGLVLPMVREWLRRQGSARTLETHGLYAQLRSGGYLARWDTKENRIPFPLNLSDRSMKRVLILKQSALREATPKEDASAATDDERPQF